MAEASQPERKRVLQEELSILEGAPDFWEWRRLEFAYAAYLRNADDLMTLVTYPRQNPAFALQLMDTNPNAETPQSFHLELLRLLINYSATVSTLVDHSRSFIRRYEQINPALFEEYRIRTQAVIGLGVVHFVQGLRNYLLHYQLPSVVTRLSFSREPSSVAIEFRLDCIRLLAWDGWKPQAKSYMEGKDSLVLAEAIDDYTDAIKGLYEWLFEQAREAVMQSTNRQLDVQTELIELENSGADE